MQINHLKMLYFFRQHFANRRNSGSLFGCGNEVTSATKNGQGQAPGHVPFSSHSRSDLRARIANRYQSAETRFERRDSLRAAVFL